MTDVNGKLAQRSGKALDAALAEGRSLLEANASAALHHAHVLLRSIPDPRAFELAAAASRKLGRPAGAEQAELAGIRASFAIRQLDDAAVAGHEGNAALSRSLIARFLEEQPENLLALTMAAEIDLDDWQLERAEQGLRTVLTRAPSFLRAIMLLTKCLACQSRVREAMDLLEDVLHRKPDNLVALRNLAQLHSEANEHERSADAYTRLLQIDPGKVDAWIIHAQELRMLGRKQASKAAFRRAISLDPNSGAAWWGLANYFTADLSDADVSAMAEALLRRRDSPEDGGPLHIALGIMAEAAGNHAEAFQHIAAGKHLRARAQVYDPDEASATVEGLIRTLGPKQFDALRGNGCASVAPIFIVGMPRSGTTLLERILSRHPQIEAGGELPLMPRIESRLRGGEQRSLAEGIARLNPDELTAIGQHYVERSRDYLSSDKPRFIDKLNYNWFRVGLIRLMLPNARIIDLRRDALDCCWSNFKMMFAEGHVAANEQRAIARFYRDYVRMIEAVDAASPGGIFQARYEDLVEAQEDQVRRILAFLGLEYDPECLDFHLSTTAVATPSSEQVRRPINRDSIGSSWPYREWLQPMIEELEGLAD